MAKKKMDKLSQDVTDAIKAGVSYGKYMAMKEPEIEAPAKTGIKRICLHCGKEFFVNHRKRKDYCNDQCRENFYYQKYKKVAPTVKICPICGKEFMARNMHYKYCGELCKKVAHCERVKACQARKAKEAES